jgi:hypothetical protein
MLIVGLAMMSLAGCDHYNCTNGATFGSTCTPSTPGLGGGGTTGSTTAAFVFVADAAGTSTTGTIDGYTLNTTASTFGATPTYTAPATPLGDSGVGMVVAQAKYLYTAFPTTNHIFGWSISADGNLTAVSGSPYAAPSGSIVSSGFLTQAIITNPAGTLLFISDIFQDQIYEYQIGSGGALTPVTGSPFSVPFAGNMATDGLGKYLYITDAFSNHTGSQVAAYALGSTGSLTVVPGSPFAFPMWQVQGDPTGQFLIGTKGESMVLNGTDDLHLYVFNIAQSGATAGALTQATGSPFATEFSPLSIAVQSNTNGNLVYSFGIADSDLAFNPVEGYALSSTGTLTLASGSPYLDAALGDLGAFDQSGSFLFIYGGITGTNGVTFQMGALDVGTGGALTQPTSTLTLPAGGFFAVTDPQ